MFPMKQDHRRWRSHRRLLDYQSPYFQLEFPLDHQIPLDPYVHLKWPLDHQRLGDHQILMDHQIFPFENTFGSDQIARRGPELAQIGTKQQPDAST